MGLFDRHNPRQKTCLYCDPTDGRESAECRADHPSGSLFCTRETGHSGPHIACGSYDHALAVWPNEAEKLG